MTDIHSTTPVTLLQDLIRCRSVTPDEGGALSYLESILTPAGFSCTRLPFSESGTPDVDNLFARLGTDGPHLCFAGHTDVVPTGPEEKWTHPPFAAEIHNGILYGRGAVDMKGGIACFVAAILEIIAEDKFPQKGSVSFLITGDEEGPAINGTPKMLDWVKQNNHIPDHCLVGEPSNPEKIGDAIKIGRRGSLNGILTVNGVQGHVAYPHLAKNPVTGLLAVLQKFLETPLDQGTEHFAPSNLEITSVDTGNEAVNIIPARTKAKFNIRYNDTHTAESLQQYLHNSVSETLTSSGLTWSLDFQKSGDAFLTTPGPLSDLLAQAIQKITGLTPDLSTSGGTSDARFIKNICPVLEFGLVNKTIHQIDEHVSIDDLSVLKEIYKDFILNYFKSF